MFPEGQIDYPTLAKEMIAHLGNVREKNVVGSTPTTTYGHGPGGLFSYPGKERPVFSAMILPRMGLQSVLPVRPSRDANPIYDIFTGVTASSGSEADGPCDDPPTAGLSKICSHSFVFGRRARQSRVFELDRMGLWTNRGEMGDQQFLGNPFQGAQTPQNPTLPNFGGMSSVLRSEVGKAMFELGVAFMRDTARDVFTGNPSNNSAGGGNKYYYGLDILINTGYQDAVTKQLCPAADSIIHSMGNAAVETNGATYVAWLTNIYRRVRYVASETGLDPAQWAFVMRWSLFYQLTEVWPCAYSTYRCFNAGTFNASNPMFTDSQVMIAQRDAMRGDMYNRTGQYLLIDGERVPVIIDDGITETVVAGASFRSSIYLVPLTVLGGTSVLYWEYLSYDMPNGAMEAARALAPEGFYSTSDNGRFLWHKKPPNNYCVQVMAKVEPRLILLTPQIAARITNVQYTPLAHERDWDTASSYYVDGGRTDYIGYGPSFWPPTDNS